MIKSIFKEIIITLLLCIAILLILSIILYNYNPLNKVIPNKVAYETPNDIKSEIEENELKDSIDSEINIVYSIDSSDLNIYMQSKSYVPGKANPFATVEDNTQAAEAVSAGQAATTTRSQSATGASTSQAGNTPNSSGVAPQTSSTQTPVTPAGSTTQNPDSTGTFLNTTGRK